MPPTPHSTFHITLQYIIKDLIIELHRLPTYMLIGLPIFLVLSIICLKRIHYKYSVSFPLFLSYLAVMLNITFLEREMGSRIGISLKLFETLGGPQNNAYVLENVLLFLPFGMFVAHFQSKSKKIRKRTRTISDAFKVIFGTGGSIIKVIIIGMLCSLSIEIIQLLTGRGYFQLDDIVMNTVGTGIGCIGYKICNTCRRLVISNR